MYNLKEYLITNTIKTINLFGANKHFTTMNENMHKRLKKTQKTSNKFTFSTHYSYIINKLITERRLSENKFKIVRNEREPQILKFIKNISESVRIIHGRISYLINLSATVVTN